MLQVAWIQDSAQCMCRLPLLLLSGLPVEAQHTKTCIYLLVLSSVTCPVLLWLCNDFKEGVVMLAGCAYSIELLGLPSQLVLFQMPGN